MVNPQSAHAGAGPPSWAGLAPRARKSGAGPPTYCSALNRSRAAAARLAPAGKSDCADRPSARTGANAACGRRCCGAAHAPHRTSCSAANGAELHWRCGAASQSAPVALIGGYSTNWRVPRRAAPIRRPDPGAQRRAGGASSPRRAMPAGSILSDPRSTNWPTPIAPIVAIGIIHWIIYPPRG